MKFKVGDKASYRYGDMTVKITDCYGTDNWTYYKAFDINTGHLFTSIPEAALEPLPLTPTSIVENSPHLATFYALPDTILRFVPPEEGAHPPPPWSPFEDAVLKRLDTIIELLKR